MKDDHEQYHLDSRCIKLGTINCNQQERQGSPRTTTNKRTNKNNDLFKNDGGEMNISNI